MLKVMHFLPFLTPTVNVYSTAKVLTVRQLFILHSVLKYHSTLTYNNQHLSSTRRPYVVGIRTTNFYTSFSRKFFTFNGSYVYNKVNKELNVYHMTKRQCKHTVTDWLLTKKYEETENILNIIT